MFEFFQNENNNEGLKRMAEEIEGLFESYTEPYISYLDVFYQSNYDRLQESWFPLIRKGIELDIKLSDDISFVDKYLDSVRHYLKSVYSVLIIDEKYTQDIDNVLQIKILIANWISTYTHQKRLTTHGLFYINQIVKQTRMLLELYIPFVSPIIKKIKTKRHFFEQGLKRLELSDSQYVKTIFSNRSFFSRRFFQPFKQVCKFLKNIKKGRSIKSINNINWINNKNLENVVRDRLYQGIKYAELAYKDPKDKNRHKIIHIPKTQNNVTLLKRYKLNFEQSGYDDINGKFHLQDNFNGFIGIKEYANYRKEIIIGFSGTNPISIRHVLTDIYQFIGSFSSAYVEAIGVIECVWHGKLRKRGLKDAPINVYGHSLGGGLMQFAVSNCSAKHIHGFGYNSAGLSYPYYDVLIDKEKPIYHLHKDNDKVFTCSNTIQVGLALKCKLKCKSIRVAHYLESIKKDSKQYQKQKAVLLNQII